MKCLQAPQNPKSAILLARMAPVDIILLDGFRRSSYPKMEVVGWTVHALLAPGDPMVLAITTDVSIAADVPCFALSDISVWRILFWRTRGTSIQIPAI